MKARRAPRSPLLNIHLSETANSCIPRSPDPSAVRQPIRIKKLSAHVWRISQGASTLTVAFPVCKSHI